MAVAEGQGTGSPPRQLGFKSWLILRTSITCSGRYFASVKQLVLRLSSRGLSLLYPLRLSQAERLSILQSLSGKLQLSAEVDLSVVADRTNGFTGADLQAVLFTAQMTAYEALHQGTQGVTVTCIQYRSY